ncbi:MAG: hypothetical protein IT373_28510 [Polyangiaceae bacterium]|nr:hypothetical protein [Polyangiaceae bacterium]
MKTETETEARARLCAWEPLTQGPAAPGLETASGRGRPASAKNYKERTHKIYLWTTPLKKAAAPEH